MSLKSPGGGQGYFFSNSNGITFGTAGTIVTATVTPGAAAGIAAVQLSNTTYTSGTVLFSNANGVTFGSSAGGAVTASYNSTQFAGTGTTFGGTNVSASLTLNSAGLKMSLSGGAGGGGAAISAAGSSQNAGTIVFSNSNGVSFGMNGSTVTGSYNSTQFAGTGTTFGGTNVSASITQNSAGLVLSLSGAAGGGGASTGELFLAGNTTGQSSASTFTLSSINYSGAGLISVGWSSNSLIISAPATTSFAAFALSGAGSSQSSGTIVFSNSNGISFGMNGSTITASGGGGVAIAASNSTFTSGTVVMSAAGGALTISNGAQSALFSVPQTSSLVGTSGISISTNGATIYIFTV